LITLATIICNILKDECIPLPHSHTWKEFLEDMRKDLDFEEIQHEDFGTIHTTTWLSPSREGDSLTTYKCGTKMYVHRYVVDAPLSKKTWRCYYIPIDFLEEYV
jgi:hypothetical protein